MSSSEFPRYLTMAIEMRPGSVAKFRNAPLVVISSVMFVNIEPGSYERVRLQASLRASEGYAAADVPQIVMVDPRSHPSVMDEFEKRGALVVPTPRSGLARPYLDAARVAQFYAGQDVCIIKTEADKLLQSVDIARFDNLLVGGVYDVLVGMRSNESMNSMSPMQQCTERVLDMVLPQVLPGVPRGVSSGVQGYGPRGLKVFLEYEAELERLGDNWKYLLSVPYLAHQRNLLLSEAPINPIYHPAMVAAENRPDMHFKRLTQLLVMLEGALQIADFKGMPTERRALAQAAIKSIDDQLKQSQVTA